LYAIVPMTRAREDCESWIVALGHGGADKVILVNGPEFHGPTRWSVHGRVASTICAQLRPRLVLFASDVTGRDLAPRLAAQLDAVYLAEPLLDQSGDALAFRRRDSDAEASLASADRPLVVTLPTPVGCSARGEDDAEVVFFDLPFPLGIDPIEYLGEEEEDPTAALETATIVVTAGAGVASATQLSLVRELATALGAELGATGDAIRKGLAPAEREVGLGARHVAPYLYVACGASGSQAHLGGVACQSEIVAVNSDPDAPIFRVASCGIVGEIEDVLPGLISAVKQRSQGATP
jgi:electron transfer flavoprotein alpha subunit